MKIDDQGFYNEVDEMFELKLKRYIIRIKNLSSGKILSEKEMNYDKVLFDSNLNIFKIENGTLALVQNKNFKAIVF